MRDVCINVFIVEFEHYSSEKILLRVLCLLYAWARMPCWVIGICQGVWMAML